MNFYCKYFISSFIFVNLFFVANSQFIKEEVYSFNVYDSASIHQNPNGIESGISHAFQYIRKFSAKNQFEEFGLYNSDTTDGYKFKINNKVWYIYQLNRWNVFFDAAAPYKKRSILIGDDRYYLNCLGVRYLNKHKTYMLKLEPLGFVTSVRVIYFFEKEKGVIAVKIDGALYLRDPL